MISCRSNTSLPVTVRRVVWGVVLLANQWFVSTIAYCQVPPVRATIQPHDLVDAAGWMKNGGYHAARQDMEDIFSQLTSVDEKRDAIFILMQSSFEDQEYEEAFQWAAEYLGHYPNDARRQTALFIRGVSAFQTQRVEVARDDLEKFLGLAPDHSKNGAASFWLAMTKLDEGDWAAAESDLQHTYEDPAALNYHDIALMGWALSLERRGAWTEAIHHLEEFITQFPRSNLLPSVKIRLASLSLRVGAPHRTLEVLEGTTPSTHSQREEYSLLQAEAALRSGSYEDAQFAYGRFVKEFPDGRYARKALYGLAWSRVKRGDYFGAQEVFDSLGRSSDSLAYAALYQSGILALLQDKSNEALARFDTLTEHSPYDFYAESAYFQMGMIRYRGKHYRDARRYFQLAARMFPESNRRALSYRMLGESNLALGDFSNAQYAFGQVRRLSVSSDLLAPSMFQEGTCLYHLGRFKSSAEMFTNYLRLFSHDVHAAEGYVWKGEALYQDYRFTEAERAFSDALRLFSNNPKRPDAVYGMAWSLFEQKKFSQAASAFERFMKDFPGDQRGLDASLRRADCYFFQGEYEKASGMYEALAAARTESRTVEYAAFQLAMSYIQRGESERGINQLRNFISRFPSSLYNEVVQFNI
ncbi:MAG: tetratricopeptide repeat protein, partial [Ignavibacteriales bacterium]|nr:tetratricopeptide repeat protein [Ignavibacteriales bacterium]